MADQRPVERLKEFLEKKVAELKKELEFYELLLGLLESNVVRSLMSPEPKPGEDLITVRSRKGDIVGYIYVGRSYVRMVPVKPIKVDSRFVRLSILNYLEETKKRMMEEAEAGIRKQSEVMDYNYVEDPEGNLREIVVKNLVDEVDLEDVKETLRHSLMVYANRYLEAPVKPREGSA